ncbi:MAG: hypothetical protein ABA06_03355 [Parcubacteria bacterium C7867-001]|nr:MAG: hypothetical protein ABA06_03355 [Parcubacteria bacterium C7867-001]
MKPSKEEILAKSLEYLRLRRTDPDRLSRLLTERRVARGIKWLREHAPAGWHRNMFEPQEDGTCRFRAHDSYDNECVLALAFESRPDLANPGTNYVMYGTVANHFKIPDTSHLGFAAQDKPYKQHPEIKIFGAMLDAEWQRALSIGGNFLYSTRQYSLDQIFQARAEREVLEEHRGLVGLRKQRKRLGV